MNLVSLTSLMNRKDDDILKTTACRTDAAAPDVRVRREKLTTRPDDAPLQTTVN